MLDPRRARGGADFEDMRTYAAALQGGDREDLWRPFLLEVELGVPALLRRRYEEEREELLGKLWLCLLEPERSWLTAFLDQTTATKCFALFLADRLRDLLREELRTRVRRQELLGSHVRETCDPGTYACAGGRRRPLRPKTELEPIRSLLIALRASLRGTALAVLEHLLKGYALGEIAARLERCERTVRLSIARITRQVEVAC